MATVQIQNLKKHYGPVEVLHGINIDVKDGSFVALVGPSGCGKSTLLRMLAGLEEVTSGTISMNDRVVNDLPAKERDIAMVFQNYALYPHMTVRQNMSFSLNLRGANKADIDSAVEKAADILGLSQLLERFPRQLSGGQRQRVAMGRAIVRNPQVFLFDEPLSNLDAKLRIQMRSEIKALQQRLKITSIYVTHDQMEAMTMADQIVVMHAGKVEQAGAPLDLYDFPANTFVATFIGAPIMNLMKGVAHRKDGQLTVNVQGAEIRVQGDFNCQDGQTVTFGIRPEHLDLADSAVNDTLPVKIHLVEPTGPDTHVMCNFNEDKLVAIFSERHAMNPGDQIHVQVRTDKIHLFDVDTGLSLRKTA